MTAEQERGLWGHAQMYRVATSDIQENGLNGLNSSYKGLCLYVDAMIAAAVAAEREACAKVCEDAGPPRVKRWQGTELETNAKVYAWYGVQFAAAIRALTTPQVIGKKNDIGLLPHA